VAAPRTQVLRAILHGTLAPVEHRTQYDTGGKNVDANADECGGKKAARSDATLPRNVLKLAGLMLGDPNH
jgi:hypothetical protein